MPLRFWDRKVSITVAPEAGAAMRWTDLRISFKATNERSRKPATGRFEVYGLGPASRKWIQTQGERCQLEAGHGDLTGLIFRGDVVRTIVERRPPDVVTILEVGDGERAIVDTRVNVSLGPGTTTEDVWRTVTTALGLPVNPSAALSAQRVLLGGATLNGPAAKYLDQLADENDADWWVQDGELQFVRRVDALPGVAELVSGDTGLIGAPAEMTKQRGGRTRVEGVKWRMLLRPDCRPGRLYRVEGRDLEGLYVARKVVFTGDSGFDKAYYCEVEAVERRAA